jgi:hypothetical protein
MHDLHAAAAAAAAAAAQVITCILTNSLLSPTQYLYQLAIYIYTNASPIIGRLNLFLNLSRHNLLCMHFHLVTLPCLLWQQLFFIIQQ